MIDGAFGRIFFGGEAKEDVGRDVELVRSREVSGWDSSPGGSGSKCKTLVFS